MSLRDDNKRTSICSFIQYGLKRKRREEDEVIENKRHKKNTVIQMIEKMTSKIKPSKKKQEPVVHIDLFKDFELPCVEWTGGKLDIAFEEDDSIFCINTEYLEFPKPPSKTSKLVEWSDDDDSTLPRTPPSISKDLTSQLEHLHLHTLY